MRQARVIFRPDGIYGPPRDQLRSIMFMVAVDDHPTTPADCRICVAVPDPVFLGGGRAMNTQDQNATESPAAVTLKRAHIAELACCWRRPGQRGPVAQATALDSAC